MNASLRPCLPPTLFAVLGLLLGTAGCVHRAPTPPLAQVDLANGYYFHTHRRPGNSPDTLLFLCFSGGGTRAAALCYGVLEQLRRTPLTRGNQTHPLLDEVDAISSVSGGSVTAAAYALQGEGVFDGSTGLEAAFLKRDIQRQLLGRTLNPFRWGRLWSKTYGRSDLAADLYDEVLFHGATFADLARQPGAFAVINATDIDSGARFSFTQYQFDLLCANLGAVRVSQAVAASSAVPGLLTPITLDNYAGTTASALAEAVRLAAATDTRDLPSRARFHFREMASYLDRTNTPYIHLVDGGVSDNLGVRAVLDGLYAVETNPGVADRFDVGRIDKLAIIVVNAFSKPETGWSRQERAPGELATALAGATIPMDRYSYETIEILKEQVDRWRQREATRRGAGGGPPGGLRFYPVVIGFSDLPDPDQRRHCMNLRTSFNLPDRDVDLLREVGGRLLTGSAVYQRFLDDLRGSSAAP